MTFTCPKCSTTFAKKHNRDRHMIRIHVNLNLVHTCDFQKCTRVFKTVKKLKKHRLTHKPSNGFEIRKSAFRKTCISYRKTYKEKMETLVKVFFQDSVEMFDILNYELNQKKNIRASIIWHGEFLKPLDDSNNIQRYVVCLRSQSQQLFNKRDIRNCLTNARKTAQNRIDDFIENGSGWVLDEILYSDIEIGGCPPLNGSCNQVSIKYLKSLQRIKPTSVDTKYNCFFEAVAFHFKKTQKKRILNQFINDSLIRSVPSPVKVAQITKFEKDNAHLNLGINVIYAEDDDVYPLRVSKILGAKENITLILYKTLVNKTVEHHYAYVEHLSKVLRRKYRGTGGKLSYERCHHCANCFQKFRHQHLLTEHKSVCYQNSPQKLKLPSPGDIMKFNNYNNKFEVPYLGFFDFEAVQVPTKICERCATSKCEHKTKLLTEQQPITYSIIIIETFSKTVIHQDTYTGTDCVSKMIGKMLDWEPDILARMETFPLYILTRAEERNFRKTILCHICEQCLEDDRVVDHCHSTGRYLGAAHNVCNLNRHVKQQIPLFCHNLSGYDSHFLVQALSGNERITTLEGLPMNTEKFRTIQLNTFLLLDSLAFLQASLSELVGDLTANVNHKFYILDQMHLYHTNDVHKKQLLLRKGVYPYEAISSLKTLRNMKRIPPIDAFYSSLTNSTISLTDHAHAIEVFKSFNCKNMLDYTNIYCATDVALLAEVVMQFRDTVQEDFGLDCW